MSGPVANSLAQLEDAAIESGLDLEFVFSVLKERYESGWQWVESRDDRETHFRRTIWVRQQMLWNQLVVLRPSWGRERIEIDHAWALGLHLPMAK